MLAGVVQGGLIAQSPVWDIDAALRLTLAALVVLFTATGFVVVRARRLRKVEELIWLSPGLDRLVFEHSPVGMLLSSNDGRVQSVNNAYTRLTGFSENELLGRMDSFQHAGSLDGSLTEEMKSALHSSGYWKGEVWVRSPSGKALGFKVARIALVDGERAVQGYLTLCQEASTGNDSERVMLWQAHHDPLTKLPNGNLFQERLDYFLVSQNVSTKVVASSVGDSKALVHGAVLSINLDGFSQVNDSMGFAAGDQVLMEAGHRIAIAVRETDTVARVGGDQFAILLSGVSDEKEVSKIASHVVEVMAEAFHVRGRELFVTVSVGVTWLQADREEAKLSAGEVMQRTDSARARARRSGGNRFVFYERVMNESAQTRYELEIGLRRALSERQLELYFQPLIDQYRGEIVSFEALLRWHHPTLGIVSPVEFIPIAEDTGMIVDIGIWIVKEAQQRLRRWGEAGYSQQRISINISTRQLRDEPDVRKLLEALDAPQTERLTLEITESLLVADKDLYRDFLKQASSLGAKIALDDFGTGYSSLSYLRDYQFDVLKIDRSFISALCRDNGVNKADRTLVASIISLGEILDLEVVAEGVETDAELTVLAELGCAIIQGYYYSKPVPVDGAEKYLRLAKSTGLLRAQEQNRKQRPSARSAVQSG